MKTIKIPIDVRVESDLQAIEARAIAAKYGITIQGLREIDDAHNGRSPIAGPTVRKMSYKR
jgi:hypothetical protein